MLTISGSQCRFCNSPVRRGTLRDSKIIAELCQLFSYSQGAPPLEYCGLISELLGEVASAARAGQCCVHCCWSPEDCSVSISVLPVTSSAPGFRNPVSLSPYYLYNYKRVGGVPLCTADCHLTIQDIVISDKLFMNGIVAGCCLSSVVCCPLPHPSGSRGLVQSQAQCPCFLHRGHLVVGIGGFFSCLAMDIERACR